MTYRDGGKDIVVPGVIVAATQQGPSLPDDISYTVQVDAGGVVERYEEVVPSTGWRVTSYLDPDLEVFLLPFKINQVVPVAIMPRGGEDLVYIMAGEFVNMQPCDDGGEP